MAFERDTRQRRMIQSVFEAANRPLSTEEVLSGAQRGGVRVSMATVYRFIRSMVDEDSLSVVELPGTVSLYELAGKGHHHHFSCVRCQRVYEIEGCVSLDDLRLPNGFRPLTHDVTISGACASCIAKAS
ncbi:MAG TPA: transcriptional repressor [Candidatus Baltobacteraceae bacterium]|nr:transcriptional repressor [Candidatus Baltobacteraceae bacterium]